MSLGQLESTQTSAASLRSQAPRTAVFARTAYAQAPAPARRPSVELASSRAFANNPNHHLWKNGRLWWIAFTLIHDGWRQERIRQSLGTDSELEARRRRDAILSLFSPGAANGCLDPEPEAVRN
jgi:hypothetical protein